MCHMSHVMCHMSQTMCRESHVIYIYINFFDNVMKLVVGGSVISYINPDNVTTIISITNLLPEKVTSCWSSLFLMTGPGH